MIHVTLRLRAFPIALALVAGASCWSTASFAQTAASPAPATSGDSIRLTDEQRMAILDSNTVESAAAARGELPESRYGDRRIHGEIGAMIGTNGTRGIYGVAEIPLGDRASAVLSFENSRYGYRR
ncbi:MAG: hypothetical protein V4475_07940 [Pseudomonadota bacterium]